MISIKAQTAITINTLQDTSSIYALLYQNAYTVNGSSHIRYERYERKIDDEFHPGPLFPIMLGITQNDFDQSTDSYYHQYIIYICIIVSKRIHRQW